jgi:CRISPR-associated protein Cas1
LLTVCQPEETLYLRRHPADAAAPAAEGPARVLPTQESGAVAYVQENGAVVSKRGQHLLVRKDGADLQRIPLAALRQLVVLGNVQVSTQALECLVVNEVSVVYLSSYGRFIAALQPAPTKNVMLRTDQYRVFTDPVRSFSLAQAVVKAKIANQRTLLMRSLRGRGIDSPHPEAPLPPLPDPGHKPDPPEPDVAVTAAGSAGYRASDEPTVRDMAELLARLDTVADPAVLLGIEGQAAQLYFSQFGRLLKSPTPGRAFDFVSRNRRPPRDPVNALLSFAYALLAKDCFSAVLTVGFDPYLGFFHAGRHGRPSLALDLMEEFRAVIADSVVLTLINNRMLTPQDFLTYKDACQLTDSGRRQFFRAYEQRKATAVKHPVFGYTMSYSRMLEVQARMLAGYVRGDLPQYVGFTVR